MIEDLPFRTRMRWNGRTYKIINVLLPGDRPANPIPNSYDWGPSLRRVLNMAQNDADGRNRVLGGPGDTYACASAGVVSAPLKREEEEDTLAKLFGAAAVEDGERKAEAERKAREFRERAEYLDKHYLRRYDFPLGSLFGGAHPSLTCRICFATVVDVDAYLDGHIDYHAND